MDISPDAILIVDHAGTIMMVNEQVAALFGYSCEELCKQRLEVLLPERLHDVHAAHREHYFAAPRTRAMGVGLQLYGRHKDGTEIPVDISLRPVLLDDEPLVIGAIRDMSEQRRAEREHLQQAEHIRLQAGLIDLVHAQTVARLDVLQQIMDALPSSIYLVYGPDARLLFANRAAASVWGARWRIDQPMQEFLATNGIEVLDAQGLPLVPRQFATLRAVQEGETILHHQETIRRPNGSILPVLVNAVVLDSSLWRYLARGETEPTTQHSLMESVALVVHQDVSALKEAEYLKDEFIGVAAHELRNPLAALKGFAEMLVYQTERGKGAKLTAWQTEALEEIDEATSRLDKLTEDLLDVTGLQAGRLVLSRDPTDLVALTRRMMTQQQLTTRQHVFSLDTGHSSLVVEIDRVRIEQVLTNVLSNAIKYSPQRGHW